MTLFWSKLFYKCTVMTLFKHNIQPKCATITLFPHMPFFRHQRVIDSERLRATISQPDSTPIELIKLCWDDKGNV